LLPENALSDFDDMPLPEIAVSGEAGALITGTTK